MGPGWPHNWALSLWPVEGPPPVPAVLRAGRAALLARQKYRNSNIPGVEWGRPSVAIVQCVYRVRVPLGPAGRPAVQ